MKLSTNTAIAAIALSLTGASAARADTILQYTFNSGSYFDFVDSDFDYAASGTFDYDATTQTVTGVTYVATPGPYNFSAATVVSPTEVTFTGDGYGDEDTYIFGNSLALGGTDPIVGGSYSFEGEETEAITAGGSVTASAAAAVPEPATWALALVGFGLIGGALRKRAVRGLIGYARA